jgi:AcrR family transcriptional regulator
METGTRAKMPAKEPRGKAATQARILRAATELFLSQGFEGTAVSEVAGRAGVSRATVFWHFSSKNGLFREAFSELVAPFRASLERDFSEVDPRKRLREQLAMSEQFAAQHRHEVAAFVRWALESPGSRGDVIATLLDLNRRFAGVLTETIAELSPPDRDPTLLAAALMLAFDGSLILSIFGSAAENERLSAALHALAQLIEDTGAR